MGGTHSRAARAAAGDNDVARLQEIASAHPSAVLGQSMWKQRSALHLAARAGASEALCAVLDVAAHRLPSSLLDFLNAPDYAGDTALALACRRGFADCARELLEAGATPLPANTHGLTALHHAAARGHAACIHLLLTATVRLPDGGRCPAAQAPVRDVVDVERFIDTRTPTGLCALHLAVLCGSHASVVELVSHGAQLDTPLLTAGFRTPLLGHPSLSAGSTALHMAAATGRLQLCMLLLHAQQQRHPGLELRRMRNARGMTPLNVALACDHRNLAALLTAGTPVPAPPGAPRGRVGGAQLPPLLRQQLLSLVHRAGLLSQLRELGLGAAAGGAPALPGLAAGPIARLEALLHSDAATATQVLAEVDELLDQAAATAEGGGLGAAAGGARQGGVRRRERRRQQERERSVAQLAAAQAGVDWTLLERNRSLWHAEHAGTSLYRRLHRRQERQRRAAAPAAAPVVAAHGSSSHRAVLLPGTLLHTRDSGDSTAGSSSAGSSAGSSSNSTAGIPSEGTSQEELAQHGTAPAVAARQHQHQAVAAAVGGPSDEAATCPVCLDLPADIAIAPCGHTACLGCCGRLASYCASASSASFGLPASGPLCPLCRAPIETFRRARDWRRERGCS